VGSHIDKHGTTTYTATKDSNGNVTISASGNGYHPGQTAEVSIDSNKSAADKGAPNSLANTTNSADKHLAGGNSLPASVVKVGTAAEKGTVVEPGFSYADPAVKENDVVGQISDKNPANGYSDYDEADRAASALYGPDAAKSKREYGYVIVPKDGRYYFTNPTIGYVAGTKVEWQGKTIDAGGAVDWYAPKALPWIRLGHTHPDQLDSFSNNDIKAVFDPTSRGRSVSIAHGVSMTNSSGEYHLFDPTTYCQGKSCSAGQLQDIYEHAVTEGHGLDVPGTPLY
jgi:hypothetical protein